jgi:tetratricopeptide (TPR) repeat protein
MKKVGKVLGKRGEQDAALSYFHNAMEQFEQLGQKLEVAELLNRIAWMYRDKDDYQAARASAQRAADLLSDDTSSIVYGYIKNMLGIIAFNVGAWDESKQHLDAALAIGRKVGSKQLTTSASWSTGGAIS